MVRNTNADTSLKPATWLLQFAVLVCTMTMAEAKPWPSQTANSMLNTSEVKVTEAFLHHPETQDRWVNLTAIPNDSSAYTNCSGQCGPPHLPLEHLVQRFLDTCDEMQEPCEILRPYFDRYLFDFMRRDLFFGHRRAQTSERPTTTP